MMGVMDLGSGSKEDLGETADEVGGSVEAADVYASVEVLLQDGDLARYGVDFGTIAIVIPPGADP